MKILGLSRRSSRPHFTHSHVCSEHDAAVQSRSYLTVMVQRTLWVLLADNHLSQLTNDYDPA